MTGSSALRSCYFICKLWAFSCVSAFESLPWYPSANAVVLVAIKGGEGKKMKDLTPNELAWLLKVCCWANPPGRDLAHSHTDGVLAGAWLHHRYRYHQNLCLNILSSDFRPAQMVSLRSLHPWRHYVYVVLRGFLLGLVPVYTGRQGMATYENGSLHCFQTIPLGQFNLEHHS